MFGCTLFVGVVPEVDFSTSDMGGVIIKKGDTDIPFISDGIYDVTHIFQGRTPDVMNLQKPINARVSSGREASSLFI